MRRESRLPLAFGALVLASAPAVASTAPHVRAQQAESPPAAPIDVLDRAQFAGRLVAAGESSGPADEFVFSAGKFHSRACLGWGFAPGPYWVRLDGGRVHFLAELESAENGVMTYTGTIDGTAIDARVEWVKPRWYWTIERTFRFRGKRRESAAAGGN